MAVVLNMLLAVFTQLESKITDADMFLKFIDAGCRSKQVHAE